LVNNIIPIHSNHADRFNLGQNVWAGSSTDQSKTFEKRVAIKKFYDEVEYMNNKDVNEYK